MKCPYCSEEIKEDASACRYCGRDLSLWQENKRLREKLSALEEQISGITAYLDVQRAGSHPPPEERPQPEDRQVLWNEYEHRHNLVWRIVFQVTLAVVFLSIVPYIAPDLVRSALEWWL